MPHRIRPSRRIREIISAIIGQDRICPKRCFGGQMFVRDVRNSAMAEVAPALSLGDERRNECERRGEQLHCGGGS